MQGPFHVPLGGIETLHQFPPGQGEECVDPLVWTQCAEVMASLQSRSVVTDWPLARVLSLEYVEDMSCYTSPVTFQNLKSGHHPLAETCGHLPITPVIPPRLLPSQNTAPRPLVPDPPAPLPAFPGQAESVRPPSGPSAEGVPGQASTCTQSLLGSVLPHWDFPRPEPTSSDTNAAFPAVF